MGRLKTALAVFVAALAFGVLAHFAEVQIRTARELHDLRTRLAAWERGAGARPPADGSAPPPVYYISCAAGDGADSTHAFPLHEGETVRDAVANAWQVFPLVPAHAVVRLTRGGAEVLAVDGDAVVRGGHLAGHRLRPGDRLDIRPAGIPVSADPATP